MERRDAAESRSAERPVHRERRAQTPDEIDIQRLVAWYFRSSPGSACERRRTIAARLGRMRTARRTG
jgi:hypothetical protein